MGAPTWARRRRWHVVCGQQLEFVAALPAESSPEREFAWAPCLQQSATVCGVEMENAPRTLQDEEAKWQDKQRGVKCRWVVGVAASDVTNALLKLDSRRLAPMIFSGVW